jgi:type IV secretory pathway TrbF-like protein
MNTVQDGQVSEFAQLQAAYDIIQQRDGTAERRAFHWQCVVWGLLALIALLLGGLLWLAYQRAQVHAFVQVVQVDDNGHVVNLGLPQDLLSYEPQEGHWMDMLAEWVRKVRWRGTDPVLTKAEWRWVYDHTCGLARQALQGYEAHEKPFAPGQKKLVAVDIKSLTKTPSPLSFQVLWSETTVEPAQPPKTQLWTGTFTVQRHVPTTQAGLLQNRLGLCVNAFDLTMQP